MHVNISTSLGIVLPHVPLEHMKPRTNYVLLAQNLVPHVMVASHPNVFHVDGQVGHDGERGAVEEKQS